jgi:hypothetical protein
MYKRLVLKEADIRAYEYSDTNPDFGVTENLQTLIIWPKVVYNDSRWDFNPFTGCDRFYLICTYIFLLSTPHLQRLLHCYHCLCLVVQ